MAPTPKLSPGWVGGQGSAVQRFEGPSVPSEPDGHASSLPVGKSCACACVCVTGFGLDDLTDSTLTDVLIPS